VSLLDALTEADRAKLMVAMDWVIPPDSSPGAGTEAVVARLAALVDSLGDHRIQAYRDSIAGLRREDLNDPTHPFAAMFVENVRDVYYAYPDTGAWADIGFVVTG
jgi:hypothetical protein